MGESAPQRVEQTLERQPLPESGNRKKKGEEEKERYVGSLSLLNLAET